MEDFLSFVHVYLTAYHFQFLRNACAVRFILILIVNWTFVRIRCFILLPLLLKYSSQPSADGVTSLLRRLLGLGDLASCLVSPGLGLVESRQFKWLSSNLKFVLTWHIGHLFANFAQLTFARYCVILGNFFRNLGLMLAVFVAVSSPFLKREKFIVHAIISVKTDF
jgi:hypothetical protein